jgi:glycosyltransferase involved in cell wall biosynthesis
VKIALCTPFKPVDHPSVSGDVTIARDLHSTLLGLGHLVTVLPHSPAQWLWRRPGRWLPALKTYCRMVESARGADCWLTYGSYYKAPDVYGPSGAHRLGIPYFLFQASYAPGRARKLATWPGYRLNRRAMLAADHIFLNRMNDVRGCQKLLPEDRYTYVRPGLPRGLFGRDESVRDRLRREWGTGDRVVVVTAAMMRHGVKAEGVAWVIEACVELVKRGRDVHLVVAGEGPRRGEIEAMAHGRLGDRTTFLGMVDRLELSKVFCAGDLFAFPGLKESVGMAYLEAQACGLPVVATDDEGAPSVVAHDRSGLITPVDRAAFTDAMDRLVADPSLRERLGSGGEEYVLESHDAVKNYREMGEMMKQITREKRS